MTLRVIQAVNLAVGDYLVHVPATAYNSESTFTSPYPHVTGVDWAGSFPGATGGSVAYNLDGGTGFTHNMPATLEITVSTSDIDDGTVLEEISPIFIKDGDLLDNVTVTDVSVVVTTSDSVEHSYAVDSLVEVARSL